MIQAQISTAILKQFNSRGALGAQAAADVAEAVRNLLREKETINMIFAAAPSQIEFLNSFQNDPNVDFSRINAFHMDEYIGLPNDAPQRFGQFLKRYLFDKVGFRSVNYLDGNAADIEAECRRYARLLQEYPPDIVCLGIGENGHIAFNDPAEADFDDPQSVKMVHLDDICRHQQVNDGCFTQLEDVPKAALTLTIPTLIHADYHFCMVPGKTKAQAVHNALYSEISEACPATILRLCRNIVLYVDQDSGMLLQQ